MVKVVSLLYLHPDIRHLQFCALHIIYVLLRKAEKKVSSYETFFKREVLQTVLSDQLKDDASEF